MGKSLTIEDMRELAHSRGGECLSMQYLGAQTKLCWRCAEGHEWEAQPNCVRNDNTWCPYCSGKTKHTIQEMKQLAKNRNGECLSDHYINAFTKLRWRCAKRHEWEAAPSSVRNKGTWCPICGREIAAAKVRLGLDEMHQLAKDRSGVCLSNTYPKKHGDKLLWRCHEGHEWEATPSTIKHNKQWCPICASGYSERLCRAMFEVIFNQKFPKSRPSWLRNSCNKSMELDGYCKELNLAFEYHGIQHYKKINFFHRKTPLDRRRKDDETKRLLCKQNYVTLIEIPYTVQPEELQDFIFSQCVILGITVSRTSIIKLADLDYYSKNRLEEMRSFAVARGGECLADHYVTIATPVKWRCQKSHEWEAAFHYIKNKGQWCPMCAKNKKLTLQDMQALAVTKGGKCLSGEYVNSNKKMRWCCAKGHEWEASANDIRNSDTWCPYCAGVVKLNLGHMISMAKKYGGECLSTDYINSKTKLRWRCAKGHEWETAPASILKSKRRTWCPYCARKAKLTIEEMQEIAKSRGGDCLSKHYINGSTKLHWCCHLGHEWMATPDNIKNNKSWCPVCANKRWVKTIKR